ncbi:hypothetical protein [Geodermatophilus sp. SYSU D00079]
MDPLLPYCAGFFDGEESIGIYRNGSAHGRTLRVQLTQNATVRSTPLLLEFQSRWGGSLCAMNRTYARPAWNWQVSASAGAKVLKDIRPWLRLKCDEADIALEWWTKRPVPQRGPGGRYLPFTAEQRAFDAAAEERLKAAKSKNAPDAVGRLTRDGLDVMALEHGRRQVSDATGV